MFKTKKSRSEAEDGTRTFTSSDVSGIAQVSLRQLQWWDERKVVSPRHEGHKRVYQSDEVIEITVIAELRRKGFSLQKIRRVLRFLQREMGKRLSDVLQSELRSAPGHRRQVDLPGRPAGADHRHSEERQAADVPGLRERSGAALERIPAQTREGGSGHRRIPPFSAQRVGSRASLAKAPAPPLPT